MNQLESLDTKFFQTFLVAAETRNFTKTAEIIGMTQSGVTQQIKKLEEQVGYPLFVRIKRQMNLTPTGRHLRQYVEQYLDGLVSLREKITREFSSAGGLVSYAMPESCLMSSHFGILLNQLKASFPKIFLNVNLCPPRQVLRKLLWGEIDFGFVTRSNTSPNFLLTPFCCEEYVLVGSEKSLQKKVPENFLGENPFVSFPGFRNYFQSWAKVNLPLGNFTSKKPLVISGEMNSIRGALTMIDHGLGVSVIPKHCLQNDEVKDRIFPYGADQFKPVTNGIFIVELRDIRQPRRVEAVLQVFRAMSENQRSRKKL